MRKYYIMNGSFLIFFCILPLCEEINYVPWPGKVWNNCWVLLDVDIFVFCYCFQGWNKIYYLYLQSVTSFFLYSGCAFNKWLMIKKNLRKFGGLFHQLQITFSNEINGGLLLATTLPGFRDCNPPWLRLSQRPWDPKPPRRQRLSSW